MAQLNKPHKLLLIAILTILLSHCVYNPSYNNAGVENRSIGYKDNQQTDDDGDRATSYQQREYSLQQADYYEQLAEQNANPTQLGNALLSAAEHSIQAGDLNRANDLALRLQNHSLKTNQQHRLSIIEAYIEYSKGAYQNAINRLQVVISDRHQPRSQLLDALLLNSFCLQKLGDYDAAIGDLIERENLSSREAKNATREYINNLIINLDANTRQALNEQTRNPAVKARLSELANQSSSEFAGQTPDMVFEQWRNYHPGEQAKKIISINWNQDSVKHIAVLVPLSSKYQKASQAVIDGIKYQHKNNTSTYAPIIEIYDIGDNPQSVGQYYQAAIQAGAELVIGPIGVQYANQLSAISNAPESVTTILLGGDTSLSSNKLARLTISSKHQGEIVAKRAKIDNHQVAAILYPNNNLGQRNANAFQEHWLSLGGKIKKSVAFSAAKFDFSNELKNLFDLHLSDERYEILSKTLGYKPKYSSINQSDIDFVFLVANTQQGRLLKPQINYYAGEYFPVYAPAYIYNGIEDSSNNLDLEGIQFPIIALATNNTISPYAGLLSNLFAMGADAYSIAANYSQLRNNSNLAIKGLLGAVYIKSNGAIRHQPLWAVFKNGMAVTKQASGLGSINNQ